MHVLQIDQGAGDELEAIAGADRDGLAIGDDPYSKSS